MSDNDNAPAPQIGGVNVSRLDQTEFSAQNITSHVEAGGHIAGRDVVIYNYYYQTQAGSAPAASPDLTVPDDLPNPYRGLQHFGPGDAHLFFGREIYTDTLVERVETPGRRLVAVVGASGSGKSSVVLAGLVPRLQAGGGWQFTHFRPGNQPILALASALAPLFAPDLDPADQVMQARKLASYFQEGSLPLSDVVARIEAKQPQQRLLLIADQFEELYTLCRDEAIRRHFLDLLLAQLQQPTTRLTLILTLRADFMSHALAYRPLAEALQDADLKLGPMNQDEQERAIIQPAAHYNITFEGGLVERILADVRDEPGRLPLLEFALTLLWEQRQGRQLTHAAYEALGGVEGALANHADRQFAGLTPEAQLQARHIFVQLVHPGRGTEDTRRLATVNELGRETWPLVKQLADARLVVTGRNNTEQETAEVIHEALIRRWQTLRGWLEEDRAFRVWQDRLRASRDQWQASNQDTGALLRGLSLAEAAKMLAERSAEIPPGEQVFIQASIEERDREASEHRRTRQRLTGAAVAVVLLIIGLLGLGLWLQSQNAADQAALRTKADDQKATAQAESARALAAAEALAKENEKAQAELSFYQTTDEAVRLAELSKLFSQLEPDSQVKARRLFFALPEINQLAVLRVENEQLVMVSKKLLTNLADVNRAGYTDDHLNAISETLILLPAPDNEATGLKKTIEQWLAARVAARKGQAKAAQTYYDTLIDSDADNPAWLYERAGVLADLGQIETALTDLDRVVALASTPAFAITGVIPVETEFATPEQMVKAVQRLIMLKSQLLDKFEEAPEKYRHLDRAKLVFPTFITDTKGITMVLVPAGPFIMGSNNGWSEEHPIRQVDLGAYFIDQYEVTNAQFIAFLKGKGNEEEGGVPWLDENWGHILAEGDTWQIQPGYTNHPATGVSWYGAKAYCEWRGGRLPTEAEWEKAARGTDERTYPWGEHITCDLANYLGCLKEPDTSPVGAYPAGISPYGAYDMAGNVWEWVQSEARPYPYQADDGRENLDSPEKRVLRGGSWYGDTLVTRTSNRYSYRPDAHFNNFGFRCVKAAP